MHDARDRNQGIWIEHSDRLYVAAYSSVASLVVTFSGYFRKMNGEIIEYSVTLNPTSDRVVTEGNQFFGAGFLLSCVASLASGNANRGQCYVRAMVQRSTGTPMVKLHDVVGGYLTDDFSPSFPYGRIEGSLEGTGALRSITGTDPAAGAELSETVPTGAVWHVISVYATLTTDATVATRRIRWFLDDGTNNYYTHVAPTAHTASNAWIYVLADVGMSSGNVNSEQLNTVPLNNRLAAGHRIKTLTTNLQAGDNWSAPQMYIEEWIQA